MLRLLTIFLVFTLFTANLISAQNTAQSGFVILASGDTIRGLILNRDSKSSAQKCVFKTSNDQNATDYRPEDLLGYRIEGGKYFISKSVPMINEGNPLFFEFLIEGKVKIYHVKEAKSRYFIEKDGDIHELLNSETTYTNQGATYNQERKEYVGMLNYLFRDATINLKIDSRELEPKSLIAVSKQYHENVCPNEVCTIYEMSETKSQFSFGIFAGGYTNSFDFGGRFASDTGYGALFGIRLQIDKPFAWAERWSVGLDLAVSNYNSYTFTTINSGNTVNYNETQYLLARGESLDIDLKSYSLKMPFSISYDLLQRRIKPYLGVGLINLFFIKQNEQFEHAFFVSEFDRSIPFYHIGFQGKVGVKYPLKNGHRIFMEMNYEISENLNINQILRLTNRSLSLVAGYYF